MYSSDEKDIDVVKTRNIAVSVCCITYNQSDYIAEAIESFLMQKTNFEIEILIHDDASTDGTDKIVKYYAEQYPDKIRAVLQKENQYSKGVNIGEKYLYSMVSGKYVALCEGDDFWTSPFKLQKQYDYMETHPNCSMCMHNGWIISQDKKIIFPSRPISEIPKIYGVEDAINGLGVKVVTNSFFIKASVLTERFPDFAKTAPTGDYSHVIMAALKGEVYYTPERMSAHRMLAKNSFSAQMGISSGIGKKRNNQKKWNEFLLKQKEMMEKLDEYTMGKHKEILENAYKEQCFDKYLLTHDDSQLKKEPFRNMYSSLTLKKKFEYRFPTIFFLLQRVYYLLLRFKSRNIDIYERDI